MNSQLALNIINQFDNELSALANSCMISMDFAEKKEQQKKLETLIKQRGESIEYIKKELNK